MARPKPKEEKEKITLSIPKSFKEKVSSLAKKTSVSVSIIFEDAVKFSLRGLDDDLKSNPDEFNIIDFLILKKKSKKQKNNSLEKKEEELH